MKELTKAIAFCRVATKEHKDELLNYQKQQIEKYAKQHNIEIVKYWEAVGSGQCALAEMHRFCETFEDIVYLCVTRPDRISRSHEEYLYWITNFWNLGIQLTFAKSQRTVDTDDFLLEEMWRMQGVYNARMMSASVKRGMHQKVAQGLTLCKPPLGYQTTTVSGLFTQDKLGKQMKTVLHDIAIESVSFKKGYEQLSKAIKQRTGKPLSRGQFSRLLRNVYYTGRVQYGGQQHPGKHLPLLSEEQRNKVEQLFEASELGHKQVMNQ